MLQGDVNYRRFIQQWEAAVAREEALDWAWSRTLTHSWFANWERTRNGLA